jgi:hypothetical protein
LPSILEHHWGYNTIRAIIADRSEGSGLKGINQDCSSVKRYSIIASVAATTAMQERQSQEVGFPVRKPWHDQGNMVIWISR